MSWRRRSLELKGNLPFYHQRSLLLLKSEYVLDASPSLYIDYRTLIITFLEIVSLRQVCSKNPGFYQEVSLWIRKELK